MPDASISCSSLYYVISVFGQSFSVYHQCRFNKHACCHVDESISCGGRSCHISSVRILGLRPVGSSLQSVVRCWGQIDNPFGIDEFFAFAHVEIVWKQAFDQSANRADCPGQRHGHGSSIVVILWCDVVILSQYVGVEHCVVCNNSSVSLSRLLEVFYFVFTDHVVRFR